MGDTFAADLDSSGSDDGRGLTTEFKNFDFKVRQQAVGADHVWQAIDSRSSPLFFL